MAKILIVEDDSEIAVAMNRALKNEGHLAEIADNGLDALQLLRNFAFDVIILDWMLPGLNGYDLCIECRKIQVSAWIIFCTGKSSIEEKEKGLDAGADDYLVKPFSMRELMARVRTSIRRANSNYLAELKSGDLALNISDKTATAYGKTIILMPREFTLLEFFIRHPNRYFSSQELLSQVWPSEKSSGPGVVRVYLNYVRQKLKSIGLENVIQNKQGHGYRFVP